MYKISDGDLTERFPNLKEVCKAAEEWYDYFVEEKKITHAAWAALPRVEGDSVESVQASINRRLNELAEVLGHTPWAGHSTYRDNAASEAGLRLTVRAVKDLHYCICPTGFVQEKCDNPLVSLPGPIPSAHEALTGYEFGSYFLTADGGRIDLGRLYPSHETAVKEAERAYTGPNNRGVGVSWEIHEVWD